MAMWRRWICGRPTCSLSLGKAWAMLLAMSLLVMSVEFSIMWHQNQETTDKISPDQQELLQVGFSQYGITRLTHHATLTRNLSEIEVKTPTNLTRPESGNDGESNADRHIEDEGVGIERKEKGEIEGKKKNDGVLFGDRHFHFIQNLTLGAHDKWIVLDATDGDCRLTVPTGWKVLVIGHPLTLQGCSSPVCTHLRPDVTVVRQNASREQTRLLYRHLAYLTAILHKAKFILNADCSVTLVDAVRVLQFQTLRDYGPMYNGTLLFNPYVHFGAWAAVPRAMSGRPATDKAKIHYVRDFDNVLVKHAFSDNSSDLVRASSSGSSGTRFDPSAPPLFSGQGSFSTAVPTCSMYHHKAFWALIFPCQTLSLRCQVLHQIIQQALFRELDAFTGFYQIRSLSTEGNSKPLPNDESNRSIDPATLASQLNVRRCKRTSSFFECFVDLADYLLENGYLNVDEHELVRSWIVVISSMGAVEPTRVSSPWRGVRRTSEVRMTLGSMAVRLEAGGPKEEKYVKKTFLDTLMTRCNGSAKVNWFPLAQWKRPLIEDVVLIVVFNWNRFFWNNLPVLETMHRPFFKHIVYCVPNVDELLANDTDARVLRHVTLVEALSDTWYSMYECVTVAARINIQGVRGYLQVGDDTLLNTWKFFSSPRDSVWMPGGFTTMKADDNVHNWSWYWWPKSRGRAAILHALSDLEQISGMTSRQLLGLDPSLNKTQPRQRPVNTFSQTFESDKQVLPRVLPFLKGSDSWEAPTKEEAVEFLTNYYKVNRLGGRVRHRAMDFFYIPQVLSQAYVKFSRHFLKRNVLIELAVPTIHFGLVPQSRVKYVSSSSLWKGDRNMTYSFYDESIFFLHPFKMKAHLEQKTSHNFFCYDYMNNLFSELYKYPVKS